MPVDNAAALHVERMGELCGLLARRVGFPDRQAELIRLASRLHDIGKVAIPDRILGKREPLDAHDWEEMKTHTTVGHRLLAGSGSEFLELAATIALTHHERVDGSGYPNRLRGDEIPIEGRIAAVCDVFDALTNPRPYHERPYRVDEAVVIMRAQRGRAFDLDLLDVFLGALDEARRIRARYPGGRSLVTAA